MISIKTNTEEKLIKDIPKCSANTYEFCCQMTAAAQSMLELVKILIIANGFTSNIANMFPCCNS